MTRLANALRELTLRAGTLIAALGACVVLQGATEHASAANWHGDYFPNVILTDQDGKQHRFYDDVIKNKVVAVQFFFTSCTDVCPAETARLRQVYDILQKRMGKDIHFYSISIDPEKDDPKALKAYAKRFKTGPGWTFLTGAKADVDLLQRKFGLLSGDLKQLRDHSTSMMFGNEKTSRWTKRTANDDPVVLANLLGFQMHGATGARVASGGSYDKAPVIGEVKPGQFLFRARCASCHRIGGGEDLGPDLAGITERRDRLWLSRWIREPDKMIAEKDPTALAMLAKYNNLAMPNLGLGEMEANALLQFIDDETKRVASLAALPAPPTSLKTTGRTVAGQRTASN